ncbi:MAG: helix-turn-helix transcriptional regulator [Desulfobacterales bacterium]
MEKDEFTRIRKEFNKTQKQLSQLLGVSLKAIHSYEQGWRTIPGYVERQLFFLISISRDREKGKKPCWEIRKCPPEQKQACPAWEFQIGHLCWFINGTICYGTVQANWSEKMKLCRSCDVFQDLL